MQIVDGVPSQSVFHTGRGGAGNYRRATRNDAATSTLTPVNTANSTISHNRVFFSSRGGAGNVRPTTERAVFSFDEELERERIQREHQAPIFSTGRGGFGNMIPTEEGATSRKSGELTRTSSAGSNGSVHSAMSRVKSNADKLFERLKF